jgi:hypothetical protein
VVLCTVCCQQRWWLCVSAMGGCGLGVCWTVDLPCSSWSDCLSSGYILEVSPAFQSHPFKTKIQCVVQCRTLHCPLSSCELQAPYLTPAGSLAGSRLSSLWVQGRLLRVGTRYGTARASVASTSGAFTSTTPTLLGVFKAQA